MNLLTNALLGIYVAGIIWSINMFVSTSPKELKDDRYYRFGYIMATIIWPVVWLMVNVPRVIKIYKKSKTKKSE